MNEDSQRLNNHTNLTKRSKTSAHVQSKLRLLGNVFSRCQDQIIFRATTRASKTKSVVNQRNTHSQMSFVYFKSRIFLSLTFIYLERIFFNNYIFGE